MRDALLGGTIVALAAGLLGYFIVVRNTAFAATLSRILVCPGRRERCYWVCLRFGPRCLLLGGAIIIGALGKRVDDRDVATGTILAMAIALGLLFSSLATKNASTMTNVLFGNLLAISHGQLIAFAGLLILLGLCVGVIYGPLLFASVNPLVARAKGVPVQSLSIIFMALLGLAVTMAVQVVGTLLLFALLVTPAATAIRLAARPSIAMFISTTISVVSVWVGLGLSAMFNMPPSFVIVAIACMVWFVVQLASHRIRLPVGRPRQSPDCRATPEVIELWPADSLR